MTPREAELRCCCADRPLLAVCGRDAHGQPFVHIKIFKQGRVYGEVVATGDVRVRCRECRRWHVVTIRREAVQFKEQPLPASIPL